MGTSVTGSVEQATLHHWPDSRDKQIVDDLISGKRFGSF